MFRPRQMKDLAGCLGGSIGGRILAERLVEHGDAYLAHRLMRRFHKTTSLCAAVRRSIHDAELRGWLEQLVLRDVKASLHDVPDEIAHRFYAHVKRTVRRETRTR